MRFYILLGTFVCSSAFAQVFTKEFNYYDVLDKEWSKAKAVSDKKSKESLEKLKKSPAYKEYVKAQVKHIDYWSEFTKKIGPFGASQNKADEAIYKNYMLSLVENQIQPLDMSGVSPSEAKKVNKKPYVDSLYIDESDVSLAGCSFGYDQKTISCADGKLYQIIGSTYNSFRDVTDKRDNPKAIQPGPSKKVNQQ